MNARADFQNLFGTADAGFEDAVQRTLWGLRRREKTAAGGKLRAGLIFAALACLLLAAATVAAVARWGVLDFVAGRGGKVKVLPEATKLVRSAPDIPQTGGHLKEADFSVRQAVYDGRQIYLVVAVKPRDGGALLLDDWSAPDDPVAYVDSGYADKQATIADYAKAKGKARMLAAGVAPVDEGGGWPEDGGGFRSSCQLEQDGTLAYMIEGDCQVLPEVSVALDCSLTPYVQDADGWRADDAARERAKLRFRLKASGASVGDAQNAEPAEFPEAGVRVDSLTLTASPMAVYYRIEYTIVDAERYAAAGGVSFQFLDGQGNKLPPGAGAPGGFEPVEGLDSVDGEDPVVQWKEIAQNGSLGAMEALPGEVALAAYDFPGEKLIEIRVIKMR